MEQKQITGLVTALAAKVDKVSGATAGNLTQFGIAGALGDTGKKIDDAGTTTGALWTAAQIISYVENAGLTPDDVLSFQGAIDCSANPNYPAANAGHLYKVSVAGRIGGASGPIVEVNDSITCTVDSSAAGDHATVGTNWFITQANIDGAVIGPASATDNAIAVFDTATGKLLKDSAVTVASLQTALVEGQAIFISKSALANAELTITEAFANTPKAGFIPKVFINGEFIMYNPLGTESGKNRWTYGDPTTTIIIRVVYAIAVTDEIVINYIY